MKLQPEGCFTILRPAAYSCLLIDCNKFDVGDQFVFVFIDTIIRKTVDTKFFMAKPCVAYCVIMIKEK